MGRFSSYGVSALAILSICFTASCGREPAPTERELVHKFQENREDFGKIKGFALEDRQACLNTGKPADCDLRVEVDGNGKIISREPPDAISLQRAKEYHLVSERIGLPETLVTAGATFVSITAYRSGFVFAGRFIAYENLPAEPEPIVQSVDTVLSAKNGFSYGYRALDDDWYLYVSKN
jgi:hypothetical protein